MYDCTLKTVVEYHNVPTLYDNIPKQFLLCATAAEQHQNCSIVCEDIFWA